MSLLAIECENCKKDGLCKAICPRNIISDDEDGYPEIQAELEPLCLNCGHCIAICPYGAIKHEDVPVVKLAVVEPIKPEQIRNLIKKRRSIRKYSKQNVPKETFTQILDIIRYAPTGGNRQPVNWTIVYDRKKLDILVPSVIDWMKGMIRTKSEYLKMIPMEYFVNAYETGVDRITFGAPHIVIAHSDTVHSVPPLDYSIALTYFEIVANNYGLGTCWAGAFDLALQSCEDLQKEVGLPQGHKNYGTMLVGYSQYKYHAVPERKELNINWV